MATLLPQPSSKFKTIWGNGTKWANTRQLEEDISRGIAYAPKVISMWPRELLMLIRVVLKMEKEPD